ncbi:uncharacterized protein LOC18790822 [Prunus persica]|uniref:uncharacterized protein LOC18790822 n=1 Tax=Prunus persica TaxID=3760 RepID=UPI0009AB6032|nr:uncharacterized protein LOC18790822 [Prunus persica]
MYHSGQICGNCYASGSVAWFDYCDKDRMSMTEIDNMVRELGYDGVISYCYSIPIYSNSGLTKLNDDQDVIDMLVFVPETRLIDIFLHHGVDSYERWFYSQSGSNMFVDVEADIVPNRGVVIEELNDNYGASVPGADVKLDSEEYDSNNVQPKYDCDDDTPMMDRWPEFNPTTDMVDLEFEVGMKFSDCKVFRAAVREQFIKRNRDVVFHEKTLQIKKYEGEHTCGIVWENPTVKSSWLRAKYMETLKSNPSWPVSSFMETVEKDYKTGVSRQQVYRAKERALRQIEGIYTEQYSRIWDYCEELRKTNPGTTTKVQCDFNEQLGHPVFQRLYVCLGACKAGFIAGCRPIIGLDGCFLKGVYRGQFLAAVGIDANNKTWVIAYAVVESECKESWVWFLELLVKDVEIVNQFGYTFISDKQKGLLLAFEQVVPNSEHKFCARHLFTNFILQFKGKALSDKFWGAAKATTVPQFARQMES